MNLEKIIFIGLITALMFFAGCADNQDSTGTATTYIPKTTTTTPGPVNLDMSLSREISETVKTGEAFTVTLNMEFNGTRKPSVVGLTENYPSGWVVSNISSGGILRVKQSRIEWLFWSMGAQVKNTTITYQITPGAGANGKYFFDGNADMGEGRVIKVAGSNNVSIQVK